MNVQPQFDSDEERAARRLIEQAGTILKGRRGDMPEASRSSCSRGTPRRGSRALRGARTGRPRRSAPGCSCSERKPGAAEVRFESRPGADRRGRIERGVDHRDRQRRHAVPARLGPRRADRAGARRPPRGASDLRGGARSCRGADRLLAAKGRRIGASRRESFIHIHVARIDDAARRDRDRRGARTSCCAMCGSACRTGGRCWSVSASSSPSCESNPPPLPVGRDRGSGPVPRMAGRQQFHLPRRARTTRSPATSAARGRCSTPGSACCARATCACSAAATNWSRSRRRSWSS